MQRKAGAAITHSALAIIAWLQNDKAATEHELGAMKNDPQGEYQVTGLRSGMAAFAGQVKAAREFGQKQREAAERLGLKEAAANEYSQEAFTEACFLNKPAPWKMSLSR